MSATLTSSSPDVLILQGASAYPTIHAESSATNAIPFAFAVTGAVPCGSTLPFTLTVTYTGRGPRPRAFDFTVQVGRPDATAVHVAYTGAPVAIPNGDPRGVDIPLEVSGLAGPIATAVFRIGGASCSATIGSTTVGIDHNCVGDLRLTLTSPSGRTVALLGRAGGIGKSGKNFCQTILDDTAATSIQAIAAAQAPFTGTFRPQEPLSAFTGDTATGTWRLHETDEVMLDSGSVRTFSLDLRGFNCTRGTGTN